MTRSESKQAMLDELAPCRWSRTRLIPIRSRRPWAGEAGGDRPSADRDWSGRPASHGTRLRAGQRLRTEGIVLRYGWLYGPGTSLVPGIAALVFDYRGFWGERRRGAPEPRPGGAVGDSLGGAHIVSVAADDPRSSPWSPRFPSTASLDGSRVARPLPPFASSGPSSGRQRHDTVEERGRASRAPPDDALPARVGCSPTTGTPARVRCGAGPGDAGPQRPGARPGRLSRHATGLPGDFYTDPAIRDRALADQLDFLDQHLQASPKVA
jgi:hypothetical protein